MEVNSDSKNNVLIETDKFPFEFLSLLGKKESWRKEIYRPINYLHKWWAKRLGSIFRGLLLGSVLSVDSDLESGYYDQYDFNNIVVFDPFMGGGTTIVEAVKLGMTTLGRDINPVACETVRVGLSPINKNLLNESYRLLSETIKKDIQNLYKTIDSNSNPCEVLYYFWVMQATCPNCGDELDLFSTYIISKNAYPARKPETQVVCPSCGNIFMSKYKKRFETCPTCSFEFDSTKGPVQGHKAYCNCGGKFVISESIKNSGSSPKYRLFAKLVLREDGIKEYLPASNQDQIAYNNCESILEDLRLQNKIKLPHNSLDTGYNTKQAINYNFRKWEDFFNARQLLALSLLYNGIMSLPNKIERDALIVLFSGVLEFNNMFASYKGEGTGAVRHMFSHHILKPERVPIEANVWGTPKSSGAFSELYKTRLLRALKYKEDPFEVGIKNKNKVYGASPPIKNNNIVSWNSRKTGKIALSCGDSSTTELPDKSINLIVTDPPFFNNVQYSELADFFYSWLSLFPHGFINNSDTTRNDKEVQDSNATQFSKKLSSVFSECKRILVDNGLLVFTYHHSKSYGWEALAKAIWDAGFYVVQAHPVYSELSTATPKSQTKDPILFDAVIVCRKQIHKFDKKNICPDKMLQTAIEVAALQINRLIKAGFSPTIGDKLVISASQFLVTFGNGLSGDDSLELMKNNYGKLIDLINKTNINKLIF